MATSNLPNEYTYFRFCGLRNTSEYIKREIKDPNEYLSLVWATLVTVSKTFEAFGDTYTEKKIGLDNAWTPRMFATLMLHLRYLCEQVICVKDGSMNLEYAQHLESIIEDILSNISSGCPGDDVDAGNFSCWGSQTVGEFKERREKINELGVRASNLLLDHEYEYRDLMGQTIQHAALCLIGSIVGIYNAIDTDEKVGDVGDPNGNQIRPGYTNQCGRSTRFATITVLSSAPSVNLESSFATLRGEMDRMDVDSKHHAIFLVTKTALESLKQKHSRSQTIEEKHSRSQTIEAHESLLVAGVRELNIGKESEGSSTGSELDRETKMRNVGNKSLYFRFGGLLATSEYIKREIRDPNEYLSLMWSVLIDAHDMKEAWCPRPIASLLIHLTHLCDQVSADRGARIEFRWYVDGLKSLIEQILANMSLGVSDNYVRNGSSPNCLWQTPDTLENHMDTFANRKERINQLGTQIIGLLLRHKGHYENGVADAMEHAALWLTSGLLAMYNEIDTEEAGGREHPNDGKYYPGYTNEYYKSAGCHTLRVFASVPSIKLRPSLKVLRDRVEGRMDNVAKSEYEVASSVFVSMIYIVKASSTYNVPQYRPRAPGVPKGTDVRPGGVGESNAEMNYHTTSQESEGLVSDLSGPEVNNNEVGKLSEASSVSIKECKKSGEIERLLP